MKNFLAFLIFSLLLSGCGGSSNDVQVATGGDGVRSQLRFLSQPARAGEPLTSFQVGLFDPLGTLVPTSGVEITISSPNATLQGDLTRTTVTGIATFENVRSNTARTDTILVASALGFSSAESTRFVVEANDASTLQFFSQPGEQTPGDNVSFSVLVTDSFGNPVNNVSVTADIFQSGTSTSLLNAPSIAVTGQSGIASFSQLSPTRGGQMFVRLNSGTLTLDSSVFTVTSVVGRDWRFIQNSPLYTDIIFGNGTFIIGGQRGTVLTSSDGSIGNPQEFGTESVSAFAFGQNLFVAAASTRIRTSSDGVTWTNRINGSVHSVAFGNGRFVSCGNSGRIFTSDDGITWTQRVSGTTSALLDIVHNGSRFVGVGTNVTVTSTDGENWTVSNFGTGVNPRAVTFGNGLFVAVGSQGDIFTSPDGITWSPRVSGTTMDLRGVAYNGSVFVATGEMGAILTSADGITWTQRTSGTTRDIQKVRFINGLFRAVGRSILLTSSDGVTWTNTTSGEGFADIRAMESGNGVFVGVGQDRGHIRSTDGENWSFVEAALPFLLDVTFGNNQFVAVGVSRDVVRSTDGLNWTRVVNAIPTIAAYSGIDFVNGVYVTTGSAGRLLTSTDGLTWTDRTTPVTRTLNATAFGNGTYVTVGSNSTVITSSDLATWTQQTLGFTASLNSIVFANGIFVAVGASGDIATSSDGITWTAQTSGTSQSLQEVIFDSGLYIAVGRRGEIITSTDGASWTSSISNTRFDLNGVTASSGMVVAGGGTSVIVKSP